MSVTLTTRLLNIKKINLSIKMFLLLTEKSTPPQDVDLGNLLSNVNSPSILFSCFFFFLAFSLWPRNAECALTDKYLRAIPGFT